MPRKNKNARSVQRKGPRIKTKPTVRLGKLIDDSISPGQLVAAADYYGNGNYTWKKTKDKKIV